MTPDEAAEIERPIDENDAMPNPVDELSAAPHGRGWLLRLFETFLVCGTLVCGATYWWLRHDRTEAPRDPRGSPTTKKTSTQEPGRAPTVAIPGQKASVPQRPEPATGTPIAGSTSPSFGKQGSSGTRAPTGTRVPTGPRPPRAAPEPRDPGAGASASGPIAEPVRTASRDPFASPVGTKAGATKSGSTKTTGPASSGPTSVLESGIARLPDPADRDRTSWQDPFEARLWQASGWSFGADGMRPTEGDGTAKFRRRYRRLMLDVEIASREAESDPLELRWVAPATGAEGRVRIATDGIELLVPDTDGTSPGEGRKADFESPLVAGQVGRLRFGATGNRLLVHWNERRVLSCDQPVAQLGRELEFSWVGSTGSLRIAHLRVEGE